MKHETRLEKNYLVIMLGAACALLGCNKTASNLKPELTVDLGDGVAMEFVLIQPGSFTMGSTNLDNLSLSAKPAHKVRITKPFYLGKYLVTQEQWQEVMGSNPSTEKGPKNPVETVSWDDCQDILAKLKTRIQAMDFCLPTEAQWEYACRAGSAGDYCYGDGSSQLGNYAWYSANSDNRTHPVGQKRCNAWGLYDMHGNVWEYCADWYGDKYYSESPGKDPAGPSSGRERILRGGSFNFPAEYLRSGSFRLAGPLDDRCVRCGLRVCIVNPH